MARSGHKTSAKGECRGATAKKALGEMLDLQVADMKTNQVKKGPNKENKREPKEKDPETEAGKKLQKDIKALLN